MWKVGVAYHFHDYKKGAVDIDVLKLAIQQCGWQEVINRRGTTWRKLPEDLQSSMDDQRAVDIACENASIIKRPLLAYRGTVYLGFKDTLYHDIFKA